MLTTPKIGSMYVIQNIEKIWIVLSEALATLRKKGKPPPRGSRPQVENHINGKPSKGDIQVNLDWRNVIEAFQPKEGRLPHRL